jgi:uncharacterized phiE125 gp8 family phage protein
MNMKTYRETSAPAFEPFDIQTMMAWLRIDDTEESAVLELLLNGAIDYVEKAIAYRFATRTAEFTFSEFGSYLALDVSPVTDIISITYLNPEGERETLDPAAYTSVSRINTRIYPTDRFPACKAQPGSIIVTASVGHLTSCEIEGTLRQAVALIVADNHRNREGKIESTAAVDRLLSRFRNAWVA